MIDPTLLLRKFPAFDPAWPEPIRARWFASFARLRAHERDYRRFDAAPNHTDHTSKGTDHTSMDAAPNGAGEGGS